MSESLRNRMTGYVIQEKKYSGPEEGYTFEQAVKALEKSRYVEEIKVTDEYVTVAISKEITDFIDAKKLMFLLTDLAACEYPRRIILDFGNTETIPECLAEEMAKGLVVFKHAARSNICWWNICGMRESVIKTLESDERYGRILTLGDGIKSHDTEEAAKQSIEKAMSGDYPPGFWDEIVPRENLAWEWGHPDDECAEHSTESN